MYAWDAFGVGRVARRVCALANQGATAAQDQSDTVPIRQGGTGKYLKIIGSAQPSLRTETPIEQ